MKETKLEHRAVRKRTPTEEIPEDVTRVEEHKNIQQLHFYLKKHDIEMAEDIAEQKGIPYVAAVRAIIRDALDLYHWHRNRKV